jgi:putative peptidoglycan lipid II flippase
MAMARPARPGDDPRRDYLPGQASQYQAQPARPAQPASDPYAGLQQSPPAGRRQAPPGSPPGLTWRELSRPVPSRGPGPAAAAPPASRPRPGRHAAPRAAAPRPASHRSPPSLARSSAVMAAGTLASRGTGFLRTFVLLFALGTGGIADAYNNANALPQTVYYLFLGGVFTSVMVPLMVKAAKNDTDRGEAYAERIFTLGVVALFLVTVAGTLAAGPLVGLYAGGPGHSASSVAQHSQMVLLAHIAMPQIFFFGMDSLLGAILNTRGRFGANMWTPVINNVVVISVVSIYIATVGLHKTPLTVSPFGIHLLGIGALLGILIQSVALMPVLRRAGFSMHLRFDFRRAELAEIRRMASWMLIYVVSQWGANLVVQRVANSAAAHGADGRGYSVYFNSWQLFQLPYAVIGISVISALLPRMSGHAADRDYDRVRHDFSTGVRLAAVIVVPATVFLAVLGPPLCEFLFAHGSTTESAARYIGEVFAVFSLGLMPFMITQLQLRVFYSFQENRAPAVIGLLMLAVSVAGSLIVLSVVPPSHVVLGLAAAYGLVSLTGAVVAWRLQARRLGSLDGARIARAMIRMFAATLPGLAFALATTAVTGSLTRSPGFAYGLLATLIGGAGALALYGLSARLLRIEEFQAVTGSLLGRLRR